MAHLISRLEWMALARGMDPCSASAWTEEESKIEEIGEENEK